MNTLLTEEDVRSKVVTQWLAQHGFGPADIQIETTFEVNLGRSRFRIGEASSTNNRATKKILRPRADILVRSSDGRNLMIVEVKSPTEPIDDDVRDQGISYARLLREGGMAPFVVLTNGTDSQIYDTMTGERLDQQTIPLTHPHAKAGFRITASDLTLQSEALQALISLSNENLAEFCRTQVEYRTKLLRSNDLYSGKKYIPSLFISRENAKSRLSTLLDVESRKIVLLVGPPQVGKTNFMCDMVDERLRQNSPSLFYPAVNLQSGLLEEMSEDFQWALSDTSMPYHIAEKLKRVLLRKTERMVIFIDGWNETNLLLARAIDRHCDRLACDSLQFVVSLTSSAAGRLLMDQVGNPSYVGEAAGIPVNGIPLVGLNQSKDNWSVVSLDRYSDAEVEEAYARYSKLYLVNVPEEHKKSHDPFLVRVSMEAFHGRQLPDTLDEPLLLQQSIERKIQRVSELSSDVAYNFLVEAATEMYLSDAPLHLSLAMRRWGLTGVQSLPESLLEAALLARVYNERALPAVDFYYGRDRDYLISHKVRDWPALLRTSIDNLVDELDLAGQTNVGREALRWFLRQAKNQDVLTLASNHLSRIPRFSIRRIILASMWHLAVVENSHDRDWMLDAIKQAAVDDDMIVRAGAAKLIALIIEDHDELKQILSMDRDFITALLEVEEEFPLGKNSVGVVILDALRSLHWDYVSPDDDGDSELALLLQCLLSHELKTIRMAAAKALGYISPDCYFRLIAENLSNPQSQIYLKDEYADGVYLAIDELHERYYGSMCRGYLEVLREDEENQSMLFDEYERMASLCQPVISLFASEPCSVSLKDLLNDLKPSAKWLGIQKSKPRNSNPRRMIQISDPSQLTLEFQDAET